MCLLMLLSSVLCEVDRVWSNLVLTLATSWLCRSLVGPSLLRVASKGRRNIMSLWQFHSYMLCVRIPCSLKVMTESVSSIGYIHLRTCLQLLLPLALPAPGLDSDT